MPRGVDLMARHSGPAVPQVAWLALSLFGLGLTLVASVRAIDRTSAVQGTENRTENVVAEVADCKTAAFPGRAKHCRLAPGDVVCLVSEDFLGSGHLFKVQARRCDRVESGGADPGEFGMADIAGLSQGVRTVGSGSRTVVAAAGDVAAGDAAEVVELPSRRLFQLPRMSFDRAATVLSECELAGSVGGAGVYCEGSARLSAERLRGRMASFLASGLLGCVEGVLGPVLDVDGSGGLTVVVGDLDPAGESGEFPFWGCVRETDFLGGDSGPGGDILYLDSGVSEISESEWRSLLVHELAHAACFSRLLERRLAGLSDLQVPRWFHESLAHLVESEFVGESELSKRRLEAFRVDPGIAPVVVNLQQMTWGASRRGPRASASRFLRAGVDGELLRSGALAGVFRESACFEDLLSRLLGGATEPVLRRWAASEVRAMLATGPHLIPQLSADCVTERRVLGTAFVVWRAGSEGLDVTVEAGDDSDWTLTVIRP